MNEKVAEAILSTPGCFRSIATDPAILACREISPYYIDLRATNSFPKQRNVIVDAAVDLVESEDIKGDIDKLVTTESAGIPICSIVADRLSVGMAYVKKEVKGYGLGKQIEGFLVKGEHVIAVDDLTTEAGSAKRLIAEVRKTEAIIDDYCVIFDRNQGATKTLADLNVKLHYLAQTSPRFMEMALRNGNVTAADYDILSKYSENPKDWSRNFVKSNPEYLRGKIAKVVKDGKITDMAPLEVLTVAHPELKEEYKPKVQEWLAGLGVTQDVPQFDYRIVKQ